MLEHCGETQQRYGERARGFGNSRDIIYLGLIALFGMSNKVSFSNLETISITEHISMLFSPSHKSLPDRQT